MSHKEKKEYIDKLYLQTGKENLMQKSYMLNYDINADNFYQDVRFLDGNIYKNKIDLLVGGSPCQSFSVNGKRGGFEDTRGTLFYEYARIINEVQPKVFIFENVKGMLTHDNGNTWNIIKNTFEQLNYKIYIKHDKSGKESPILNAMDYGIPQNRQRIFVVGINKKEKIKKEFNFPEKIKLNSKVSDYLDKKVDAKYYLGQKGFEFVTTHPSRAQVGCDIMRCQKANQQFNWNGDFIFESDKDIVKIAVIERHKNTGNVATALLRGYGIKRTGNTGLQILSRQDQDHHWPGHHRRGGSQRFGKEQYFRRHPLGAG